MCPVKKDNYYDAHNLAIAESTCEERYVKYYPHADKLLIKESGQSEVKKYWARNRLEFIIDDQLISKVHVRKFWMI